MAHTLDVNRIDEVIEGLLCENLTKWQRQFVESIAAQKDEGRKLTERQLEVLESIHLQY